MRFKVEKKKNDKVMLETKVIVDNETGVQYLFVESGYAGGMTVLVDREGKPLLKKHYRDD